MTWKDRHKAKLKKMLVGLKFPDIAATYIVYTAGYSDISDYIMMTSSRVRSICQSCRKPGGGSPGVEVPHLCEHHLSLACAGMRLMKRCSRPVKMNKIMPTYLRKVEAQLTREGVKGKDLPLPKVNTKDWPKTFEAVQEYLGSIRGTSGNPLVYLIRDNTEPPFHADDPSTNYLTVDNELIP
jgi:hypothetical protein